MAAKIEQTKNSLLDLIKKVDNLIYFYGDKVL